MRSRHLRLLAVVGLVVLALSGFTTNKSSGGSSGGGKSSSSSSKSKSGGGGCGKDSKSSSYSGSSSTGGTTGGASKPRPTTQVIECVGMKEESATVRVTAPPGLSRTYTLRMDFLDDTGYPVTDGKSTVTLEGSEVKNVKIPLRDRSVVNQVVDCRLEPVR